jgi:hypothetical protein
MKELFLLLTKVLTSSISNNKFNNKNNANHWSPIVVTVLSTTPNIPGLYVQMFAPNSHWLLPCVGVQSSHLAVRTLHILLNIPNVCTFVCTKKDVWVFFWW